MDLDLIFYAALAMLAAGGTFLYLLLGRGRAHLPQDAVEWAGAILSGLVVATSVYLIVLVRGGAPAAAPVATEPVDAEGYPVLAAAELNAPAPDFAFHLVDDDTHRLLSAYRGQVVLVNFWATWCAPCLQELPDLNQLQARYGDQGLVVLTLSDEPREELIAFEETTIPLETVSGYVRPEALPEPYSRTIRTRPTSYVIDREGVIREYILGARTLADFERLVAPHLRAGIPGDGS